MKKQKLLVLTMVAMGFLSQFSSAEEKKKTRDEMVLDDRAALKDSEAWIYNDLEKGYAEARATGKPLMIVHRCIP